ncbi:MAG TPA: hypothetical protein VHK91_07135 [Flavisolibacter sp.]|jgi:hypothetical protein|nr:hypothetical protein [Flavisolibacter sp.]
MDFFFYLLVLSPILIALVVLYLIDGPLTARYPRRGQAALMEILLAFIILVLGYALVLSQLV